MLQIAKRLANLAHDLHAFVERSPSFSYPNVAEIQWNGGLSRTRSISSYNIYYSPQQMVAVDLFMCGFGTLKAFWDLEQKMLATKQQKSRRSADLADGGADELAAEHDVIEQDSEVTTRLGELALLVQHMPCNGHEVRPHGICCVIHGCARSDPLYWPPQLSLTTTEYLDYRKF